MTNLFEYRAVNHNLSHYIFRHSIHKPFYTGVVVFNGDEDECMEWLNSIKAIPTKEYTIVAKWAHKNILSAKIQ